MVFASHASELVRRFCNKAIVMEHGKVEFFGPTEEALAFYGRIQTAPI